MKTAKAILQQHNGKETSAQEKRVVAILHDDPVFSVSWQDASGRWYVNEHRLPVTIFAQLSPRIQARFIRREIELGRSLVTRGLFPPN